MPPLPDHSQSRMVDVGLLTLGKRAFPALAETFAQVSKQVKSKLYVRIVPPRTVAELCEVIPLVYLHASQKCAHLDVRVLLRESRNKDYGAQVIGAGGDKQLDEDGASGVSGAKPFKHVCLGGTFDRLHNGHKVLLSTAALLSDKVTCGVTGGAMNNKKILLELMEPLEQRMGAVDEFLRDISSELVVDVQEIRDPFGPAIVIEDLDCIVVSEETVKGGDACNVKRREKGLQDMAVHKISLVEGADEILQESKLSSSTQRRQLLGTLLKEPNNDPSIPEKPYVIGLTGGIASGKTHISKFLEKNGCEIADADKIVHELYNGNPQFTGAISEQFGSEMVENGKVDRKKLGEIVFKDKEKRDKLTSIIWPAVKNVVMGRLKASKSDVFVIDAALLVEAGWQKNVRQLWTTFIPRTEAIKRIKARDNLTEEEAESRIDAQTSNEARINESHVVFSSLWEYAETERQVTKALDNVRKNYIK